MYLRALKLRSPAGTSPAKHPAQTNVVFTRARLEDIKITLEDNRLTIRGEKTRTEEQKNSTYHRLERVYGTFERSFSLTHALKSDKIEATYRDGVLEVTVPKAEEAKAREIPIKVAR